MEVRSIPHDASVVLEIGGVLDTPAAREFEAQVRTATEGRRYLVIDLSGAELLTSACIRVLVTTHRRLKGAGGALWLCALNAHVTEVFAVAGLARHFHTAVTREEALVQCLTGPPAVPADAGPRQSELARRIAATVSRAVPGVRVPPLGTSAGARSALTMALLDALTP
ncbi:MAG: STAS domain-containing protein [Acidobacteria bacterium]|nr:STAS domain-containing protein [Acidobacteriota bacterium]